MSSQQSMFHPPEQSTMEQQKRNEYLNPKPSFLRRNIAWIGLVITLLILFVSFTVLRAVGDHFEKTIAEPTLNYTVQTTPHLVIHGTTSNVSIHGGSGTNIVIKATKHMGIFDSGTANTDIVAHQDGDTVDVTTKAENYFSALGGGRSYVSLDITVPTTSNIQLSDTAGSIDLDNVDGSVALNTKAGDITMKNAKLSGQSSLTSDAGNINFNGSLNPQGHYQFVTKAGNVTLALPGDASVDIHAQSTIGEIKNDFGSSSVGNPPRASVDASTEAGNITINKQ